MHTHAQHPVQHRQLNTLAHIFFQLPVLRPSALPGVSVCQYLNGWLPVEEPLACKSSIGSPKSHSYLEPKFRQALLQACSKHSESTECPARDTVHPHRGPASNMPHIHRMHLNTGAHSLSMQTTNPGQASPPTRPLPVLHADPPSLGLPSLLLATANSSCCCRATGRTCQPLGGQSHQRWADTDPSRWRWGRMRPRLWLGPCLLLQSHLPLQGLRPSHCHLQPAFAPVASPVSITALKPPPDTWAPPLAPLILASPPARATYTHPYILCVSSAQLSLKCVPFSAPSVPCSRPPASSLALLFPCAMCILNILPTCPSLVLTSASVVVHITVRPILRPTD